MRFAMIGLSLTHPYAFSEILMKHGHSIIYVWDQDIGKVDAFGNKYHAIGVDRFQDIPLSEIDGVFIETESDMHCNTAAHFIQNHIPVFIDKVMALNTRELREILFLAETHKTVVMTGSAIRYMPEYVQLRKEIHAGKMGRVVAISADVRHNMENYLKEPNTWQDNPATSGGEIMNFGIHGVEPIYSILGPGVKWVQCHRDKICFEDAQSEDLAIMNMKFNNGSVGTVCLAACINDYGFSMKAYGLHGVYDTGDGKSLHSGMPAEDRYGYETMILEYINAIQKGSVPVPYDEVEELVKVLIALRISADENRIVYLDEIV